MKERGTFFSSHTAAAVIFIITFGFLPKAMSQVREVPFPYPTIQKAIDAASNGDTVLVHRGTYRGTGNRDLDFHNKKITVKSEDPSNPDKVADTIIDCQGGPNNSHRGFIFQSGEDAESVLIGFTIINGYIRDDGQDGSLSAIDGTDGLESRGGAILCINGSSPTIRNCIIRDCLAEGGWGGDGADGGDIEPNGGNGGNAAAAYGGAIYCGAGCSPIVRSCTISNCSALPGTPGSGGDGWDGDSGPPAGDGGDGGNANNAYGGAIYFEGGGTVLIMNCIISDCNAVRIPVAGSAGLGGSNGGESGSAGEAVSFACGGGVYCGEENLVAINGTTVSGNSAGSEAGGIYYDVNNILVMTDCSITSNSAESGSAGGILIHHGASATLDGCNIHGNIANSDDLEYALGYGGGGGIWCSTGTLTLNGCNIEQNIARGPVAVGGGIYAGDFGKPLEAIVDINDCSISGNIADYGGAVCVLETYLDVRDSNVFDNIANYGAGLYFVFSDANVAGSSFTNNSATDLSGMELYCSGGGLYSSNSSSLITHSLFTKNTAEGSGGGLYLIGPFLPGGSQEITNCLIAGNNALLDGGGISSNMGATAKLTNCTLGDNGVDNIFGSGGALSCYDSDVNVINSILWHNTGAYGPQIAIGDPLETENPLSRVFVEYSTVEGGETDVFVGQSTDPASGPMLKWLTGNIVDDPHLVPTSDIDTSANYYLSHIPAGQLVDSPCIDAGSGTAAELEAIVGKSLTTRTDHESDSGVVDMGYHHQVAPDSIPQYPLTISVDGNEGGELYAEWGGAGAGSIAAPNTVLLNAGTVAELTAVADTNNGYTVGTWSGTDDDATPGPSKTVTMYRSRAVKVGMPLHIRLVPSQYPTIDEAVHAAVTGDVIIVSPKISQDGHIIPYTVSHKDGINVNNKTITITSEDPLDPDIVARTIIDCQGSIDSPKRAFKFIRTAPANNSVLTGFTIINGFMTGPRGADGEDDANEPGPGYGEDGVGDGKGGAIFIENGSNPTISHCVIKNCTVVGGIGGRGGKGIDFNDPNNDEEEAMDGGLGGRGSGDGWGGAIYVGLTSNAFIYGCTIINNTAGGGIGGDGGIGGNGSDSQDAGGGGDGGRGEGYGRGGAIYCKHARVENCIIENNHTRGGIGGKGGPVGLIGEIDDNDEQVVLPGEDGAQMGVGYGGGLCTATVSDPCIVDCNFVGNHAKGHDDFVSTRLPAGGAIYVGDGIGWVSPFYKVYLTRCSFEENFIGDTSEELELGEVDYQRATGAGNGGAVYSGLGVNLFITDCMFLKNNNHNSSFYFEISGLEYLYPNDEEGSAGGAIYLDSATTYSTTLSTAIITDSVISGNSAYRNGGGIYAKGKLDITNSSVSGNKSANENGGGLYCSEPTGPLKITQSTFGQNSAALLGGGLYCSDFDAQFSNSYFVENQALQAGGLYLFQGASTFDINDCTISNNTATVHAAGGMWIVDTPGMIRNCIFAGNKIIDTSGAGGALNIYAGSPEVFNCLFTGNSVLNNGGAVTCAAYAYPFISNCTFANNNANNAGGGVYCDSTSGTEIINSIFANNSGRAIYEKDNALFGISVTYSHFWHEPTRAYGKDFYLYNVSYEANNKFDSMQRFAGGPLGDYYLMAGGPAIDYGYGTAAFWGLDRRTTQVSCAFDVCDSNVDLGYHYLAELPQFPLEVEVIGPGTFELSPLPPDANGYYLGTIVRITVFPEGRWRVKSWKGTSDESSTDETAIVVISPITRKVIVELESIATWHVPTDHPTLQRAIDAAGEGDTIVIAPGEYQPPGFRTDIWQRLHLGGIVIWGKNIVITSSTPDAPDLTILRGMRFIIGDVGPETLITGFTVRDTHWKGKDGEDGKSSDRYSSARSGYNGVCVLAGAMGISNASPTIVNLVIDNISIKAGHGGNGEAGDDAHPNGGNGGWGGSAYGGAICLGNSSPTFKGVRIRNCTATGGNGGNGGDAESETTGYGGRGGNWEFKDKDVVWWESRGLGWYFPMGRYGWPKPGSNYYYDCDEEEWVSTKTGVYDDYWLFTAMGGGVYIDAGSNPVFKDCTFSNNRVEGGYCGLGGVFDKLEHQWPDRHQRIESFGGAVYAEVGSSPVFEDCNFSGNFADNEHSADNHSPYISYGGALASGTLTPKARSGEMTLKGCTFSNNDAAIGGAVFWADTTPYMFDCNFIDNTAFEGAAIFASEAKPTILATVFKDNKVGYTAPDPCDTSIYHEVSVGGDDIEIGPPRFDIFGLGGGLFCSSSPAAIGDCRFLENTSSGSGGGAYLLGDTPDDFNGVSLNNCLFAGNVAVIDGGGISVSFDGIANLLNCTLADNTVTGIDRPSGLPDMAGYGGGLACTYNGTASLKNTIIWSNRATQLEGRSISIGAYDPNGLYNLEDISMLTVSYSDIEGGEQYAFIRPPMHGWPGGTLIWVPKDPNNPDDSTNLHGMTRDDPFFITGDLGDYYLGHVDANDPDHIQEETSRCFDRGDGDAGLLPFGEFRYTTRTDNESDIGPIDIGYHFYKSGKFSDGDINFDVGVDLEDIAFLASHWLENCSFPGWCSGSDIDWDGTVNFVDYALLFETYGEGDTESPVPNPMKWAFVPAAKDETSVTMTAAEAFDNSGRDVQYYFACVYSDDPCTPGKDSGWTLARTYTDLNLIKDMEYGYKVKARDDANNQTKWSFVGYAITGEDTRPPTPNPMTWAFEPVAAGYTSIIMTATTAVDDFGGPVEYYFERYAGPGSANSGWQLGSTWTDVILSDPNQLNDPCSNITVETQFGYRAKARDVQADPNNYHETGWSKVAYATLGPDAAPPVPNPMEWESPPSGNGADSLTMTAVEAMDRPGTVVEYYFWCVTDTYYNSDWQTGRTYTVTGLNPAVEYCFVIIARDENDNRTEWSLPACASPGVDEAPPLPNPMTWDIPPAGYTDTSVIMTATEAWDSGSGYIEYEFKCVFGPGHDRGPDPNRMYLDTGLAPETQYGYMVRAIDGFGNATEWSLIGYATSEDASPPTPNPMTWAVGGQPRALGTSSVTMTAATAYDPSGVEYYFENIDGRGHDRIWQDSPTYTDTGLPPSDPENPDDPNAAFSYRVKARDKSLKQNETQPSEIGYAYTFAPPTPNPSEWDPAADSNGFSGYPHQTYNGTGSFGYGFSMRALPATHANGVEYYFECTNLSGFSSGWQSSPLYFRDAVGNEYLTLWFRVKTREAGNPANETGYSPAWPTRQ